MGEPWKVSHGPDILLAYGRITLLCSFWKGLGQGTCSEMLMDRTRLTGVKLQTVHNSCQPFPPTSVIMKARVCGGTRTPSAGVSEKQGTSPCPMTCVAREVWVRSEFEQETELLCKATGFGIVCYCSLPRPIWNGTPNAVRSESMPPLFKNILVVTTDAIRNPTTNKRFNDWEGRGQSARYWWWGDYLPGKPRAKIDESSRMVGGQINIYKSRAFPYISNNNLKI